MEEEPQNPYPENIIDEASGIEVANELHRAWEEGNQLRKAAEEGRTMENLIKKARQEIVGSSSEVETEASPLTQCAVDIATVALTAFNGDLRDKALDIAKAIADYEDTLKAMR